jgi:hypothetical protein
MTGEGERLRADAALVGVGTWLRHGTVRHTDDPYGKVLGIVCDITRERRVDDDGEITEQTVYRYRNPDGHDPLNVGVVQGCDVDPSEAWTATPLEASRLVRRIGFEVGRSKTRTGIAKELRPHERTALLDAVAVLVATT